MTFMIELVVCSFVIDFGNSGKYCDSDRNRKLQIYVAVMFSSLHATYNGMPNADSV